MPAQEFNTNAELGEAPYIYAPYPDNIVQVHEGNTPGEKEVIDLLHEHWPEPIDELVAIAEEEHEDGEYVRAYSGSFIRNVLRNFFAPADLLEQSPVEETEVDLPEGREAVEAVEEGPDDTWHKIFRMGIRAALENGLEPEEALEAFESGYIEGEKLSQEITF